MLGVIYYLFYFMAMGAWFRIRLHEYSYIQDAQLIAIIYLGLGIFINIKKDGDA